MSTLQEIASEAAFESHTTSLPPSALLVISFHAPWAAPCAQMRSLLTALASTYPPTTPPSISFLELDAESLPDISESYDVTAVPFLVLQRDGKVLESVSGCDAAKVRGAVERHMGQGTGDKRAAIPPALETTPRKEEGAGLEGHDRPIGQRGEEGEEDKGQAKNLSAYAPGAGDAKTAPEMTGDVKLPSNAQEPESSQDELNARLEGLVKAAPVMLFMKGTPSSPQCGFSRQLVGLLREGGVRYGFFNILADEDVRQGLKVWADWPTFPQLWVGGELVGGLDIVRRILPQFGCYDRDC